MYTIAQLIFRFMGIASIIFAILLSTEIGEVLFIETLNLPVKNSVFRVALGLTSDIPSAVDIAPEGNEQPIFGILDVRSFVFVAFLIFGFIALSYEISQIIFVFREAILRTPADMRKRMLILSQSLKGLSDAYYQKGASALKSVMKVSQMPRVWPVLIENIELKVPLYDILDVMGNEAGLVRKQYDLQIKALSVLANISPSIGVIGTVLGLIKLLYNLSDPSQLGPSMALALLTTLYGLFISVIIFRPLAVRLENMKNLQMDAFQLAAFWISLLAEGKPSFYIEQKFSKKIKNK